MNATFVARALFGPPRPVLVLTVVGDLDLADDDGLRRALRHTAQVPGATITPDPDGFRRHFGCRELASSLVVDLRETTFIAAHALARLAHERDEDGCPPRLVVPDDGVVRRALAASGLDDAFELYTDLADAVLADAGP